MSGPIQVIPAGLLGFLQLKNAGRYPREFGETLDPTIELLDWYLDAMSIAWPTTSSVAIGPGTSQGFNNFSPNTINVPQTEWWALRTFTIQTTALTAGDIVDLRPCIRYNFVGTIRYAILDGVNGNPPPTALPQVAQLVFGTRPVFIPPGCDLGFWSNLTLAGAETFTANLQYTRLPI
jgi:hypothetical protein